VVEGTVIGLDLGTSSCKAIAFSRTGQRVAEARRAYDTRTEGSAVTQVPGEWIAAALECLAEIAREVGAGDSGPVQAIGLSGQICTHLLVDSAGRPLADAVTWQDARSEPLVATVDAAVPPAWLTAQLDTQLPPGAAWPLPRLAWFAAAYPDLVARTRYVLAPKDYLVWVLTGAWRSDTASWRGLARPDGTVCGEALDRLQLPNLLPPLALPLTVAGYLTGDAAAHTGLPVGTPVVLGLNDLDASLVGIGAFAPGTGFNIGGTSEHLGAIAPTRAADWRVASVPLHAVDTSRYAVYGVTSNAGSVLTWLARTFPGDVALTAAASTPGANGLTCVPYLYGERAPIWDAQATGGFVGLNHTHGPADFQRAALEGIACNLRAINDTIPVALRSTGPIRTTGGTARSELWNAIKAAVLHQPLQLLEEPESAALGAAIMAAVGTGWFDSVPDAVAAMVRLGVLVEPDPQWVEAYDAVYDRYCRAAAVVPTLRAA